MTPEEAQIEVLKAATLLRRVADASGKPVVLLHANEPLSDGPIGQYDGSTDDVDGVTISLPCTPRQARTILDLFESFMQSERAATAKQEDAEFDQCLIDGKGEAFTAGDSAAEYRQSAERLGRFLVDVANGEHPGGVSWVRTGIVTTTGVLSGVVMACSLCNPNVPRHIIEAFQNLQQLIEDEQPQPEQP